MESNNLPPFYVGEEVEYVTGKLMPKGTKVIVTKIFKSPCGCWSMFHDGPKGNFTTSKNTTCGICRSVWPAITKIGEELPWITKSFRRLQRTKPMTLIKLAEIQETEKKEVLTLN